MAYVYVFQCGDANRFKIGSTQNQFALRMNNLPRSESLILKVFDVFEAENGFDVERILHDKFAQYQSSDSGGNVSFIVDPETLKQGLAEVRADILKAKSAGNEDEYL